MAQILVRGVAPETVARLKKRAQGGGRSLEAEVRIILDAAARMDMEEARRLAAAIRRRFRGRTFTDSAQLIREDRER